MGPGSRSLSLIDFLRRASACNSCRGHGRSLGVAIRPRFEKSCVSKRHGPLTDIYLPLSLLFLFFFLPLPFFSFLSTSFLPLLPLSSLSGLERSLCTPAGNLSRKQVEISGSWVSLRGSLSALQPQEHFPSSAPAAGCREEDEDEDESGPPSGAEKQKRREERDEAQDNEDVVCVGSSAAAATHFSGELNVLLTFLFPCMHACMHGTPVFQEQKH